jgi:hypothetical protein
METIIYYLHKGDNVPFYIGKTKNKKLHRSYQHKRLYGKDTLLEVIDEIPTEEWKFWEKYYISLFKSWGFKLTNKNNGGGGPILYSEESKNKKSESLKKVWKDNKFKRNLGKKILNVQTGKIYNSCIEAANELLINVNTVTLKCKKEQELKYIDNWKIRPSKAK